MSIFDSLKNRSSVAAPLISVVVVGLIILNVWLFKHFWRHEVAAVNYPKAAYSDDDGKSWFIDDSSNVPPYDHNGKQAVLAYLYKCDDGKAFVGYLMKFPADGKIIVEKQITSGVSPNQAMEMRRAESVMLKKPGQTEWLNVIRNQSANNFDILKIVTVMCPDGKVAIRVRNVVDAKP